MNTLPSYPYFVVFVVMSSPRFQVRRFAIPFSHGVLTPQEYFPAFGVSCDLATREVSA